MFLRSSLCSRFHFDFAGKFVGLPNLLHVCIHSLLKRPAVQSFRSNNKLLSSLTCMYLPPFCGVKRVADTFVEVSLVFGVFVAG